MNRGGKMTKQDPSGPECAKTESDSLSTTLLERQIPEGMRTILYAGPRDLQGELPAYCAQRDIVLSDFETLPKNLQSRVDLCILVLLSQAPDSSSLCAIGTAKNLLSERLWLLVPDHPGGWLDQDLFSLGLHKDPSAPVGQRSFSYKLENYNQKRSWNSPEGWANPDKWHLRF